MELGHNVMHGQWDWMNDPEIHSSIWEWDNAGPSAHWKHTHNYLHHKYTNVLGMDDDVGYGLLRVTRDQRWKPFYLGNPVYNAVAARCSSSTASPSSTSSSARWPRADDDRDELPNAGNARCSTQDRQAGASRTTSSTRRSPARHGRRTLTANLDRQHRSATCGPTPSSSAVTSRTAPRSSPRTDIDNETHGQWYLRQMLGSANFEAGPVMDFMTGNLSYQIEHHLFPDLPSNRYAEIAVRVQAAVRQVRPAVHHGFAAGAVLQVVADHRQAVAAEQVPHSDRRRRARNRIGTQVHRPAATDRSGHRQAPRPAVSASRSGGSLRIAGGWGKCRFVAGTLICVRQSAAR